MRKTALSFFILFFGAPLWAAPKSGVRAIDRILSEYRSAAAVKAKVDKTVTQEWMGTTKKSQGEFYFSKGKLRLDITQPEKSTVVYDGKIIWLESSSDGDVVVTKVHANEIKKSNSLLTALFDQKGILKAFHLLKKKKSADGEDFAFEPKEKKNAEIVRLELTIKGHDLTRVSYSDQNENTVTLAFSDIQKGAVPEKLFYYSPPAHAEVTDLR